MLALPAFPNPMIRGLQSLLIADKRISLAIFHTFEEAGILTTPIRFIVLLLLKLHTLSIDGIVWFPVIPVILLFTANKENLSAHNTFQRMLIELYIGSLLGVIVELTLKPLFKRTRPSLKTNDHPRFVAAENFSFPSGHTLRAFYVAAAISLRWAGMLETQYSVDPFILMCGLFIWAGFVGLSRVAVGRHFFLDVMAGAFAGLLCDFVLAGIAAIPNLLGLVLH